MISGDEISEKLFILGLGVRVVVVELTFTLTDLGLYLTLITLEAALSFDNAAILAALVHPLPEKDRKKALLYGLVGAYIMRTAAIFGAAFLIANPSLKLLGGAYLLYLALRHLLLDVRRKEAERKPPSFFGLKGFWGVVVTVEVADLAFALDQVLVAVALTDHLLTIVLASMTAILFLRIAASYMARIMDWFPTLETLAYLAVGFVGIKLLAVEGAHLAGYPQFDIPKEVSVGVTFSLIVLPVIVKYVREKLFPSRARA